MTKIINARTFPSAAVRDPSFMQKPPKIRIDVYSRDHPAVRSREKVFVRRIGSVDLFCKITATLSQLLRHGDTAVISVFGSPDQQYAQGQVNIA